MVIFVLSKREIGQPALAALAAASNLLASPFSSFTFTSRWICVTVHPVAAFSMVDVAVVRMVSGVIAALPNSADRAMEKHPAWAAAINSSGLVPGWPSDRKS